MGLLSTLGSKLLEDSVTSKLTGQPSTVSKVADIGGKIVSPQAKEKFSQLGNAFTASPIGQQVEKVKPLVAQGMDKLGEIGNALSAPVKPIIEEYQYQSKKQQAKSGLRERLPNLTLDEIEQSGVSDEEKQKLLTIYDFAGKDIGGMEKVSEMQAQTSGNQEWYDKKQYFGDQRENEGVIEQGLKGLVRTPFTFAQSAISGPENIAQGSMNLLEQTLGEGALNPLLNTIGGAIKGDGYKPLPTWYNDVPSTNQFTENVASNIIGAGKEAITTDKTYAQANEEMKKQQYESGKGQGIGGALANIGGGAVSSAFNIMAPGASALFAGASEMPGAQYATQGLGAITQAPIDYAVNKTGGTQETAEQIGSIANLALPLGRGKIAEMKPTSTTGKVIQKGALGVADAIINPIGTVGNIAGKIPSPNIKGGLSNLSDNIQTGLNRMTKGEINKFQEAHGVSPGKFLNDMGIVESGKPIESTLVTALKESRNQADVGTESIKGNFKMPEQESAVGKIDYMKEMLLDNYQKAIDTKKSAESVKAKNMLDKYDTEGLSMSEINDAKRIMANNNPVNWNTDHASNRTQLVKELSNQVREWQFKTAEAEGFTNLKQINKQTQALYSLLEGITKWNEGTKGNNMLGLTDYLAFSADPSLFVAKQVLSSGKVRSGIVKGLNKISGRVAKPMQKATIEDIQYKQAQKQYGNYSNPNNGISMDNGKRLALPAPSGKATGAKNFRVNQPLEARTNPDITNKTFERPTTGAIPKNIVKEILESKAMEQKVKEIERELTSAIQSKYNPNKPQATKTFLESKIIQGKLTEPEAMKMVEKLRDEANGFDKPHYEKLIKEGFSKETFDDLINNKQVIESVNQEMTPKQMYIKLNKMADDGRFGEKSWNDLANTFKEKTGVDLMNDPTPDFDSSGNIIKKQSSTTPLKQKKSGAIPKKY